MVKWGWCFCHSGCAELVVRRGTRKKGKTSHLIGPWPQTPSATPQPFYHSFMIIFSSFLSLMTTMAFIIVEGVRQKEKQHLIGAWPPQSDLHIPFHDGYHHHLLSVLHDHHDNQRVKKIVIKPHFVFYDHQRKLKKGKSRSTQVR